MLDRLTATIAATAMLAAPAFAGSPEATPIAAEPLVPPQPELVFTLRGGVSAGPEYFGSDEYSVGPDLGFRFNGLRLRNGREFGNFDPWADTLGWGLRGSFRYIGARDSSDFDDLAGLDDIDAALELGLGVGYTAQNFAAFADVRRGFGGHENWVAEAGADFIARPNSDWRLSIGPRLFWGDDGYADTYFGVDASEASALNPVYDADGGLLSAGIEIGARYKINENWGVEGALNWQQYTGDAEDSPIVRNGSDDQWKIRVGLTRVVRLRF